MKKIYLIVFLLNSLIGVSQCSLSVSVSTTNTTDSTSCDGLIVANPVGGTGPYTYSWNCGGCASPNSNQAINLCPGSYSVTVVDANGCIASGTGTVMIGVNNDPCSNFSMSFSNILMPSSNSSCDGYVNVDVLGGTAPYSFVWNNLNTTSWIDNLCSGTYSVCVTDNNGCQLCDSIFISDSLSTDCTTLAGILNLSNVSSSGICDGSMSALVSGGVEPYNYFWNTGETTQSISNLCEGMYVVDIIDANGCSLNLTDVIGSNQGNIGDTIVLNGNIINDSTVIGTISSSWIDICDFDFNTVTNAYISSYVDLVDSTEVTWIFEFNDGTSTSLNLTYLFSPGNSGTYNVILQLYCGLKSNPKWLVAYDQMYYNGVVGLTDISENKIKLFPNPSSNLIHFSGINSSSTFKILDCFGRIQFSDRGSEEVNISHLETGVYSVYVKNGEEIQVIRFVKN